MNTQVKEDIEYLQKKGTDILVSTPGRILDLIKRNGIITKQIKLLVLDEVDELNSRGFGDQIDDIWEILKVNLPKLHVNPSTQFSASLYSSLFHIVFKQVCFFASSYPPDLFEMREKMLQSPISVVVKYALFLFVFLSSPAFLLFTSNHILFIKWSFCSLFFCTIPKKVILSPVLHKRLKNCFKKEKKTALLKKLHTNIFSIIFVEAIIIPFLFVQD